MGLVDRVRQGEIFDFLIKNLKYFLSGTLELSSCINATMGVELPMLLSKPHFMHGDASLRAPFDGLEPDEEKVKVLTFVN